MLKHYNIKIYGQVQGVFFRDFVKEKADLLGVFGFVDNELDGTVYVEAEGKEDKLEEFIKEIKKGPRGAVVENLEIKEGAIKNLENFNIKY